MELEQAQSTVWVLSFHTVIALVLSVFCNLFFKLTLEYPCLNIKPKPLFINFFLIRLQFWRIHPDPPRWTAGFFFFSLRTQCWTEECWGTLCLSVLVWHKRGSACRTMHCSCLLFCLEGTSLLVASSSSGLKPSISPFGCLRVSPVRRLPSAFWFALGTAGPVDLLLIPQKPFLPPVQHEPTEVSKTTLFLYNMCPHLTALPGHWTENGRPLT